LSNLFFPAKKAQDERWEVVPTRSECLCVVFPCCEGSEKLSFLIPAKKPYLEGRVPKSEAKPETDPYVPLAPRLQKQQVLLGSVT